MNFQTLKETVQYSMKRVKLGEQATQLTFYLLLSLVPILLIIANVIPLLPISADSILNFLQDFLPKDVFDIIADMLVRYLHSYNGGSLSFGIIVSLWSSSQAFNVMQCVFNDIYGVPTRVNFLIARLFSFVISSLFMIALMMTGLILAYGGTVLRVLQQFTLIKDGIDVLFEYMKWIVAFIVLFVIFSFLYYIVPNVKRRLRDCFLGSCFATIGMLVTSQVYSIYVSHALNSAMTDGTIGIFIVLILWLYVLSMVIILGAWVNVLYYDYKHTPFMKKVLYEEKIMTQIYYSKHFNEQRSEQTIEKK